MKDFCPFVIIDEKVNEIVQLNELAKQSGIKKHMGLASSIALSDRLEVTSYAQELESQELTTIATELYSLVSDIFLDLPKGIYLNLQSQLKLYGTLEQALVLIKDKLSQYELSYHFANSYSPFSAKVLAKASLDRQVTDKSSVLTLLSALQIQSLELDKKAEQNLVSTGVKQIKHLLSIPLKELAIRFDLSVTNTIGYIKGELKQKLVPFHPESQFYVQHELNFEISNSCALERPISKLLEKLERFLIQSNQTTQSLEFCFTDNTQQTLTMTVDSAIYQTRANKWQELLNLKLEQLKLNAPIREVALTVSRLHPDKFNTPDMLSNKEGNMEKVELVSILQAKLGKGSVSILKYEPEHLPERSTQLINRVEETKQRPLSNLSTYVLRPALLLQTPVRLKEQVKLVGLPERLQTNWWNDYCATRDYFIAQNSQRQWYWVFREPNQQWYVHGYFS